MDENKNKVPQKETKKVSAPPVVKKEEAPKVTAEKKQVPQNKDSKQGSKKTMAAIIPIVCAGVVILGVLGGVLIKNHKDNATVNGNDVASDMMNGSENSSNTKGSDTFFVTDNNGVVVTDPNGEPVTYVPATTYIDVTNSSGEVVTDAQGEKVTTVVYQEQEVTVNVKVTDEYGEPVTNSKGEEITKQDILIQNPNDANVNNNANGSENSSNTKDSDTFFVTDNNGVVVTDPNGEPVTYVPATTYIDVTNSSGEVVTDAQGEKVTTVVYQEQEVTVNVKVTDESGEPVTNSKGEEITKQDTLTQNPNDANVNNNANGSGNATANDNVNNNANGSGNATANDNVNAGENGNGNNTDGFGGGFLSGIFDSIFNNNNNKENKTTTATDPDIFVVTDNNGVAVTNQSGVPVTYVPKTTSVGVTNNSGQTVTDAQGNKITTVVYQEQEVTVNVKVTNDSGEQVTNSKGEEVTKQDIIMQDPNDANGNGNVVLGTTAVHITDGQGNTAVQNDGKPFTTIVEITSNPVTVEPAAIDWKTSLGGTSEDYFSSIETDKDGNYIAANVTNSKDGQFAAFADLGYAAPYTVLVKYDKSGNLKWQKPIGHRRGTLQIMDVLTNEDGTFYAIGYGKNVGGVTGKGYYDGVVYKFDQNGNEIWHKIFGTSTVDMFNSGTKTSDGGVVVVGTVGNNDFDALGFGGNELESAACIVKYDTNGNLVWKNIVGGNKDYFNDVVEGTDGNIYTVGNFYSGKLFESVGSPDSGVVKFSSKGKYIGVVSIAGRGIESFTGITACKNGGVVVVGKSNSSDAGNVNSTFVGDVASRGGYDAYIIKFDNELKREFIKPFRGQYDDDLVAVVEKEDGSFIAVGKSNSSTRDFKGITTRGGDDMVIASFDKYGNLTWARSFGGTQNERSYAICLAKKDGYVVAGRTNSRDIDMKGISQYVSGQSVGVIVKFPE